MKVFIKYEILKNIYTFKFLLIFIILIILFLSSFYTMFKDYNERNKKYIEEKDKPETIAIPTYPLSIFVKGLEEEISSSFIIDQDLRIIWKTIPIEKLNLIFSIFPAPDLLFIVKIILSLIVLLFSFDSVSGEKENGTLQMILSNSFSRTNFLLGKFFALYITISIPFLYSFLMILTILAILIPLDTEMFIRIILFFLISELYLIFFLIVGMSVSILSKRSFTSLIILLFIWTTLVFVIPTFASLASDALSPLPSESYYRQAKQQHWVKLIFLSIHQYGNDSFENIQNVIEKSKKDEEELWKDYQLKLHKHLSVSEKISKISPAGIFQDLILSISSTGFDEYDRLKRWLILLKDLKEEGTQGSEFSRSSIETIINVDFVLNVFFIIALNSFLLLLSFILFSRADVRKL